MLKAIKSKYLATFALILCLFIISRVGIYTVSYFGYNLFSKYTQPPQYIESASGYTRMQIPELIGSQHLITVKLTMES